MPVLSEIKVRSPKDGDLLRGRDPEELATAMAGAGIAGLSIVTAPEDFDGDLELVRRIRRRVDVPILRKDFTREMGDLDETVEAGADAILLTAAFLDDETLGVLHDAAHARGLETLVETRSEAELARVGALGLQPDLLGINNRDITLLERDDGDVSRTERLAAHAHDGQLLLSEFLASTRGVGYFIMNTASMFDTTGTMAGIVLIVVPTVLVVALLQAIEEQVAR